MAGRPRTFYISAEAEAQLAVLQAAWQMSGSKAVTRMIEDAHELMVPAGVVEENELIEAALPKVRALLAQMGDRGLLPSVVTNQVTHDAELTERVGLTLERRGSMRTDTRALMPGREPSLMWYPR